MVALTALGARPAGAQDGTALVVSPAGRAVEIRVGERRGFSAVSPVAGVRYSWSLDGTASGSGSRFEFRPGQGHVGSHEVSVTATAGETAARHTWTVQVEAVAPPKIVRAAPSMDVLQLPADEPLQLELQVEPSTVADDVTVRWTVDGAPAGEGGVKVVRAPASGTRRVRAVATSAHGGAVMREWQLVAASQKVAAVASEVRTDAAPAPSPTLPPRAEPRPAEKRREQAAERVEPEAVRPRIERAPKPKPPPPEQVARVAPRPEPEEAPPPPAPPPPPAAPPAPAGVSEDDVRALLFRYEQAWRTRDVVELKRIGNISSDEEERSLHKYFAGVRDLDVAVHVIDLKVDGRSGTVRFTRHDRFKNPSGREISQRSPPIEKTIVRTPDGVKFAPRS
jgi:hypothetical protein